jgi:hypothetical protein
MTNSTKDRYSERGSAGIKFLAVLVFIVLVAHAGYNYIPVAYDGASLKQEMDTAVVKGISTSGRLKPADVVAAHMQKAIADYRVPADAIIEVTPMKDYIQAHVEYTKKVNMLPFGIFKYDYKFNYTAAPQGYLMKE